MFDETKLYPASELPEVVKDWIREDWRRFFKKDGDRPFKCIFVGPEGEKDEQLAGIIEEDFCWTSVDYSFRALTRDEVIYFFIYGTSNDAHDTSHISIMALDKDGTAYGVVGYEAAEILWGDEVEGVMIEWDMDNVPVGQLENFLPDFELLKIESKDRESEG